MQRISPPQRLDHRTARSESLHRVRYPGPVGSVTDNTGVIINIYIYIYVCVCVCVCAAKQVLESVKQKVVSLSPS